jgi:2-polyprenyl-6-methoxyphenol hydroxylase-like FAD-dependent oxidoreductase
MTNATARYKGMICILVTFVTYLRRRQRGKRKGGLNYEQLKKLMKYRAFTLLRSDLSKIIYQHLDKDIEFIFGDTIQKIEQNEDGVTVTFYSGNIRSFDLVVGADGLH